MIILYIILFFYYFCLYDLWLKYIIKNNQTHIINDEYYNILQKIHLYSKLMNINPSPQLIITYIPNCICFSMGIRPNNSVIIIDKDILTSKSNIISKVKKINFAILNV